jgi:hypothetical protein
LDLGSGELYGKFVPENGVGDLVRGMDEWLVDSSHPLSDDFGKETGQIYV